ncbi:hypothetical protein D3C86_1844990 [compost metagenome]
MSHIEDTLGPIHRVDLASLVGQFEIASEQVTQSGAIGNGGVGDQLSRTTFECEQFHGYFPYEFGNLNA